MAASFTHSYRTPDHFDLYAVGVDVIKQSRITDDSFLKSMEMHLALAG